MINILSNTDRKKCSACMACLNACGTDAIFSKTDEFGFEYPEINSEKCVNCGKCSSICEGAQTEELRTPIEAYAATNRDKSVLMQSSSGGAFSVLADYVLWQSGAVCGCVYDKDLMPVHICAETQDEVVLMRKSKYAQSDVGLVYRDVLKRLKDGQFVLFTGTPCQVAALYAVVGHKYDNLLTVDLICHGVPSRTMFKKFLEYLEGKYSTKITEFDFRSKKYGWQRYTAEFKNQKDKTVNIGKVNEFYLAAFTSGNIMRPSCFDCRFAQAKRIGDITIGDFWGHAALDLKCDKKNGISVLTINTPTALGLVDMLSRKMVLDKIDYAVAVKGNHCLNRPTQKGKKWDYYMQAFKSNNIDHLAQRYRANNKKKILRGTIKLLVPIWVVNFMNKRKYRR